MSKKARKYMTVLLAVLISTYAVAVTVFAQDQTNVTAETDNTPASQTSLPPSGSSSGSSSGDKGNPSTGSSSGSDSGSSGSSGQTNGSTVDVTFNLNGGTGLKSKSTVDKGTKVSELKTPSKKGYQFAGWTSGGSDVSGSMEINSDISLSAKWEKKLSSDGAQDSGGKSIDTRQSAIDAAASAAEQATSEPDALSSQDWSELLSSGESSSAVSSEASSAAQSSQAAKSTGGGFSTLLMVGIILIVLGVAGIGLFIYLQFIRKGPGGPGSHGGPSGKGGNDDTIVFTDISSYSDGKKHDSPSGSAHPNKASRTDADATRVMNKVTAATPQNQAVSKPAAPAAERMPAEERRQQSERSRMLQEKSQAKPTEDGKSDFDWEKFFKEE